MLNLLLALSLAGGPSIRQGGPSSSITTPSGSSLGSNCACAQVNSKVVVRGETEHVSQDGNIGYCSKTGTFDVLDAGDLVACTANIPRVQSGAVLAEGMTTNLIYNGTTFNTWGKVNVVSAAPTVVADLAYAPDGQKTADFICYDSATSGVGLSSTAMGAAYASGLPACPIDGGQCLQSVYLRGALPDGGECGSDPNCYDGGIDFCAYDGANWRCSTAHFDGNRWQRSARDGGTTTDVNGYWIMGNESLVSGVSRPTQCLFAWAAEAEGNVSGPSSPIASNQVLSNGQLWTRMADQVENRTGFARTAWLGDSLSANTVASTSSVTVYPRAPEVYATQTGRTVDNWAVNGATFATDCEAQWSTWAARSNPQQTVVFCGTNDIIISGLTGHALWTTYETWVEHTLIPSGTKVILSNLTPWKGYSGYTPTLNGYRLDFNSDMASWCADADGGVRFNVTCVDTASGVWDPADHDQLLAINAAPDHLHFSLAGAADAGHKFAVTAP